MPGIDRRQKLGDEPFSYRASKDGKIVISWTGRRVTTLAGEEAARFLSRVATATPAEAQLVMAKATGNFKRGNERRGGQP